MRTDLPDGDVVASVIGRPDEQTRGQMTNLAVSQNCESWPVPADYPETMLRSHHWATLRRIGWLDQKGRVWTRVPATADFDGGSLTPLLVDVRD